MWLGRVASENRALKITLSIELDPRNINRSLVVHVYNPAVPYCDFIRRRLAFVNQTSRKSVLKLPQTSEYLMIRVYDKQTGRSEGIEISKMEIEELDDAVVLAHPDIHKFIPFAQSIASSLSGLPNGYHSSEDDQFLVQLLPQIVDQKDKELITPARIHRITGRIQINKTALLMMSVPVRLFILLHEQSHFSLPTRDEVQADLSALRVYLDLGYPSIEAIYAATKVFGMHKKSIGRFQIERTKIIRAFIDQYKRNKKRIN